MSAVGFFDHWTTATWIVTLSFTSKSLITCLGQTCNFLGDALGLWMMVHGVFEITVVYTLSLTLVRYIPAEIEIEAANVLWRNCLLYLMMYLSENYHVPKKIDRWKMSFPFFVLVPF